jgi:hypothetical protein
MIAKKSLPNISELLNDFQGKHKIHLYSHMVNYYGMWVCANIFDKKWDMVYRSLRPQSNNSLKC